MTIKTFFLGCIIVVLATQASHAADIAVAEDASAYFPASYSASKKIFLETDSALNLKFEQHLIQPDRKPEKPDDWPEILSVDVLKAEASNSKKAVILVSGTHGSEAPAGAALQRLFRQKYLKNYLAKGISVYLIHSMNPYGFQTGRRVTQNNIDLNRNFIFSDQERPPNKEFAHLKEAFTPESKVGSSAWASFFFVCQGLFRELFFGSLTREGITNAVAGGQFEFENALFFGGQKPESQAVWFDQFYRSLLDRFEQIIVLDVHTGLGEKGVLHVMPADEQNKTSDLYQRLKNALKTESAIKITPNTSKGFYNTEGGFAEYCERVTHGRTNGFTALAFTLEYGTSSTGLWAQLWTLTSMSRENQLAHFGTQSLETDSVAQQIKLDFKSLFNPPDKIWQKQVIDSADKFFNVLESEIQ